jgi:hypothetical protein
VYRFRFTDYPRITISAFSIGMLASIDDPRSFIIVRTGMRDCSTMLIVQMKPHVHKLPVLQLGATDAGTLCLSVACYELRWRRTL